MKSSDIPESNKPKEKILIIEGNISIGEKLSDTLEKSGYPVFLLKEGSQIIKSILDILPQLIILDMVVPGMDVYDILKDKDSDIKISKIPVFLISTQGIPINMNKIPANSVADFITSLNFDVDDIQSKINRYFGNDKVNIKSINKNTSKKILWVEDDKLIGSILEKKFLNSGLDLFHAKNGEEAISYLKNNIPSLIVLDLMLPGMDGFEILQKVRMEQQLKNIPAMILSNLSKPSDVEKAKLLGATKFMVKASSSLDQIVTVVKGLI